MDPIFNDIPWEIVTDDNGQEIGTVYLLLPDRPARRGQKKKGHSLPFDRTYIPKTEGYSHELD